MWSLRLQSSRYLKSSLRQAALSPSSRTPSTAVLPSVEILMVTSGQTDLVFKSKTTPLFFHFLSINNKTTCGFSVFRAPSKVFSWPPSVYSPRHRQTPRLSLATKQIKAFRRGLVFRRFEILPFEVHWSDDRIGICMIYLIWISEVSSSYDYSSSW